VVRVTKDGRTVRGLRASDFVVTDSGVEQKVAAVSESAGIMIAVAVDVSQSSVAQLSRISRGAQALASAMRDDDRMTVVTISDAVTTAANNVPRSARLTNVLSALMPDRFGMTALWDGLYTAMTLADSRDRVPYVLVSGTLALSGGGDNASWLTLEQVTSIAKRSDLIVDAVWNSRSLEKGRPDRGPYREMDFVYGGGHANAVVDATGGQTFSADDPELPAKLSHRVDEIRDCYILTYVPRDVSRGGWHPVNVTTPAGRASTRPGYGNSR
jgi:VWFA-related protein